MQDYQPAKLLRLHFTERDRYRGKPLHQAIVEKCQELKIAGATVFRGVEGFGDTAEIHRSHLLTHDLPIIGSDRRFGGEHSASSPGEGRGHDEQRADRHVRRQDFAHTKAFI